MPDAPLPTPPGPPPPPGARPRKPASFWLALVLGLMLLFSLGANALLAMAAAVAAAGPAGTAHYEEILVDGERFQREKVVVLPIHGVIMEEGDGPGSRRSVSEIREMLRSLREDDDVKAVVLDIDSPGGGVTASDQIFHELKRFRKDTGIPIVALFGDVAASGGYYVAMAADHVVAHTTSLTGSIGVISQFPMVKELMDKVGVEITTIKSLNDQGKESYKDIGSPFRDMTLRERELLQNLITEMWERFVAVVAEGRQGKLDLARVKALADGRIFSGAQAKELKLVDEVGYQEAAFAKARELGGAPEARVVRLKREPRLFEVLSGMGARGPSGEDVVRALERTGHGGPRLMYLWSGS